jgi:hypothetical protein
MYAAAGPLRMRRHASAYPVEWEQTGAFTGVGSHFRSLQTPRCGGGERIVAFLHVFSR